ncbi:uncharacterized protein KGF55_000192 [Candida pseudojiufengensis]|uniref:uncharacterized protein n=1 Tax=Candida pseudojiufengensis TaxID=497109 RepID=UPI00222581F4|nr:uncharacterized protein KGF55_000192 [Candida pseudojiufengensis]KAI5966783.1 hypothetical protein KGF55_000192 [Candida pseudojiufengensis]
MFSIILFIYFIIIANAVKPNPNPSYQDRPIFKITSKTHDKSIIIDFLQKVANKITVSPTNLSKFQIWSTSVSSSKISPTVQEQECIENTNVKYYIRSLKLTNRFYEASECRINLNPKMKSILQPTENIHNMILRDENVIDTQLKYVLLDEFNRYEQFKEYKFNNFDVLNYDLNCLIDFQQLMQIEFKETVIEVNLEQRVEVHDSCGFLDINSNFMGTSIDYVFNYIPLNGTFFCRKGKSISCNRAIAESSNSRYKLPDF